ncbi:MAG: hypothetical protein A4E63_02014 [Syntrophorhabdus sp. PtaU1.Bin050]|nr:MAG: hypothetical protein A4E63_02014 [Syntrophorhabdus sp. PtaU1.Bin050]
MSKYEKLTKEIAKLDKEIEENAQTLAEVQERVDHSQDTLDALWGSLKVKLMEGNKTSVKDVEEAIDEAKRAASRDRALLEGLQDKLPALEQRREALVNERNEIIVNSGDKWLTKEVETYEAARENLLRCVRRLSAASTMLHECGDEGREIARARLGEVWGHLRTLKLPSIKCFSAGIYTEDRANPDLIPKPDERNAVRNELTK